MRWIIKIMTPNKVISHPALRVLIFVWEIIIPNTIIASASYILHLEKAYTMQLFLQSNWISFDKLRRCFIEYVSDADNLYAKIRHLVIHTIVDAVVEILSPISSDTSFAQSFLIS